MKNKINKRYLLILFLLITFISVSILVFSYDNLYFDTFINNLIRHITNIKTYIFKIITFFGSSYFIILLCILLIVLLKDKKNKFYVAINLIISSVICNLIIKNIVRRDRPLDMLVNESSFSFPSGHSFVSTTFYGFLIYLVYNSNYKSETKFILISLLLVLILMIGISRIYLGVHYPSDVLGGFVGGLAYLLIFIEIIKGVKYEKK